MSFRILVIANHTPPEIAIAAHRIASWLRYWPKAGAEVDVVTTRKHPLIDGPLDPSPPSFDANVYQEPYLPALAYAQGRRGGNWGTGSNRANGAMKPRRRPPPALMKLKARLEELQIITPFTLNHRFPWVITGGLRAVRLAKTRRYDAIVASSPIPQSHLLAALAGRATHTPYVLDYRDQWTSYALSPAQHGLRLVDRTLERGIVKHAAAVVVVSNGEKETFEQTFHRHAEVMPNGVDRAAFPAAEPRARAQDGVFRIGYFGTTMTPRRDATPLLRAIAACRAKPWAQSIRVLFCGRVDQRLREIIDAEGYGSFVEVRDVVPHSEALRLQRSCDVLLLLDWNEEDRVGILTGKVFEYLYADRPILLLGGGPRSELRDLVVNNGFGSCFRPPYDGLEAWLEGAVIGDGARTAAPNRGVLDAYDREAIALRYLELLRAVSREHGRADRQRRTLDA
jgi:hypothetical protein